MANGNPKKSGGRDMVMESRHLLGVFLGVVVLCGVFFTLGYVMGRTQYETSVRAALTSPKPALATPVKPDAQPQPQSSVPPPSASEWTFPSAAGPKKTPDSLKPAETRPVGTSAPLATAASSPRPVSKPAATQSASKALWKAPLIPRGAIVLQVAALTREGDALALAEALQKKEFPAFVLTPGGDNLYRVQVGPYADVQSAELAKRALEREGFKAIAKR